MRVQVAARGGEGGARVGGRKKFCAGQCNGFRLFVYKGPPVGMGGFGGEVGL